MTEIDDHAEHVRLHGSAVNDAVKQRYGDFIDLPPTTAKQPTRWRRMLYEIRPEWLQAMLSKIGVRPTPAEELWYYDRMSERVREHFREHVRVYSFPEYLGPKPSPRVTAEKP